MEQSIYKSVVHDRNNRDNFELERQVYLLALAGAAVWRKYMEAEPKIKPEDDPMLYIMRELYQQLAKTDIFMGGYAAGRASKEREQ